MSTKLIYGTCNDNNACNGDRHYYSLINIIITMNSVIDIISTVNSGSIFTIIRITLYNCTSYNYFIVYTWYIETPYFILSLQLLLWPSLSFHHPYQHYYHNDQAVRRASDRKTVGKTNKINYITDLWTCNAIPH